MSRKSAKKTPARPGRLSRVSWLSTRRPLGLKQTLANAKRPFGPRAEAPGPALPALSWKLAEIRGQ